MEVKNDFIRTWHHFDGISDCGFQRPNTFLSSANLQILGSSLYQSRTVNLTERHTSRFSIETPQTQPVSSSSH